MKFRNTFYAVFISVFVFSLSVIAQNAPAAGGRAGGIGAVPGGTAPGGAAAGRGAGRGMGGGRGGAVRSPEIASDNKVTFRISAPQATSVSVSGDWGDQGGTARGGAMGASFPDSLAKDVVPFIEKSYRVLADKNNRAVAGLSMGGGHTTSVTLSNPTMFGYIGVFSAGGGATTEEAKQRYQALKDANPKLYYVACGVEDPLAYASSRVLAGTVRDMGFNYIFRETSGGHTWYNWRIYLTELAPLLFR
jgi:hypothetical protein